LHHDFVNVTTFLGSLDPRVNTAVEEVLLNAKAHFADDSYALGLLDQWLTDCRERSLLPRLSAKNERVGGRLTWAEPLEDELDKILDKVQVLRQDPFASSIDRTAELMIAGFIQTLGIPRLISRWLDGFRAERWREQTLVADLIGEPRTLSDPSWTVQPEWLPKGFRLSLNLDDTTLALHRNLFVTRGVPNSDHPRELVLILLNIKNLRGVNDTYGFSEGDDLMRRFVSQWQELVGDRVIRWTANDFLILWEYGETKNLLTRLSAIRLSATPSGSPEQSATMAGTHLGDDWAQTIREAKRLQTEAQILGLPFLI